MSTYCVLGTYGRVLEMQKKKEDVYWMWKEDVTPKDVLLQVGTEAVISSCYVILNWRPNEGFSFPSPRYIPHPWVLATETLSSSKVLV